MTLALVKEGSAAGQAEEALDRVFFALSDPVRRAILRRLDESPALVSEIAEPFDMSLQAVSRHIQVLVRAGLVAQERTGRIARCNLDAAPLYDAAVWLNRYTKYWQQSFDDLAAFVKALPPPGAKTRKKRASGKRTPAGLKGKSP
ncbi:MAG: metalloregulator ArsR/SmtB family transcription factor [Hyphomonadaceae bacterium]|nr:metalloregulator ArsR/SmtB family transcription factor [Hyphomonadaceae bacterium]